MSGGKGVQRSENEEEMADGDLKASGCSGCLETALPPVECGND